jgi:hypothetical protein
MLLMVSVNLAFGQTVETDSNGQPPRDEVRIHFTNMGNLLQQGTISVGWHYPNPLGLDLYAHSIFSLCHKLPFLRWRFTSYFDRRKGYSRFTGNEWKI